MSAKLQDVWLRSERPQVRSGPAPARYRPGKHEKMVRAMDRGQWVVVTPAEAKALAAAATRLGGRATRYLVSETRSCFKVLEAPWKKAPQGLSLVKEADATEP